MLKDRYNRIHDYLRLSITDNCNFRCTYCMPNEKMNFLKQRNLISSEEIFEISKVFVQLGVNKIRLTGGEPLVRKDLAKLSQNYLYYPSK